MKFSLKRGMRLYKSKRYEQALKELKGLEIDPAENPELAYYIGLSLTQLEKYDDALLYLEQVVNSQYSFLHVHQCRMVLGYIYTITGRYKLAEFEFDKIIKSGIKSIQAYASLGYLSYLQRHIDDSIAHFIKALEINPHYPNALNSLGYIYAEEEIDKNKSLELCKYAVNLKPNNAVYLDSLGWSYYKLGNYAEARKCMRKALDLLPGNKEIAHHMKIILSS